MTYYYANGYTWLRIRFPEYILNNTDWNEDYILWEMQENLK